MGFSRINLWFPLFWWLWGFKPQLSSWWSGERNANEKFADGFERRPEAFGYEVTRPSISPYLVDTVSVRTWSQHAQKRNNVASSIFEHTSSCGAVSFTNLLKPSQMETSQQFGVTSHLAASLFMESFLKSWTSIKLDTCTCDGERVPIFYMNTI